MGKIVNNFDAEKYEKSFNSLRSSINEANQGLQDVR